MLAQTLQERRDLVRELGARYLKEGPCIIQLRVPAENSVVHGDVGGYDLVSGTWAYRVHRPPLALADGEVAPTTGGGRLQHRTNTKRPGGEPGLLLCFDYPHPRPARP